MDSSSLSLYSERLSKGHIKDGDKEPELGPFHFYVDAFRELNTCRGGMGNSPIPFTAIADYVKIYKLEDFDELLYYIRAMDNKLMELDNAKGKSSKRNKDSSSGRGKGRA